MNRIYKVIYSKARQCYIVVSELAKSNHKSSQQGADHTNTPALARIIAVALAAGALTWGSVPEVSWAADTGQADTGQNAAIIQGGIHYFSVNPEGGNRNKNYENDGAVGVDSLAVGAGAHADGRLGATALGNDAVADGERALAVGNGSKATGLDAIAIGTGSQGEATGTNAIAIGEQSHARGEYTTTVGSYSEATAQGAVSLGQQAKSKGAYSTSIGFMANGMYKGGTAADHSTAVGAYSESSGLASIALGGFSKATKEFASALGYNSKASATGSVALGVSSVADREAGWQGYHPVSGQMVDTSPAWQSSWGAISVGAGASQDKNGTPIPQQTRQIINLAAGTEDTDAVNVAQLKAAQTHFYSVNSTDATAGNYNNDGAKGENALAAGVEALAKGDNSVAIGTNAKAQNDALAVGESANAGNNGIAIGMHANAGYGQNMALGYYASVANGVGNSTALGYGSQVTKRDILTSDESDGVISVGRSVGQSGEKGMTRRIINVKAGVNDTDAVNVSQLKQRAQAATTEVVAGTNIASVTKNDKTADGHTIYTVNAKGTTVSGDDNFNITLKTDDATNVTDYAISLKNTITIGSGTGTHPITINGTDGVVSGLTNTTWDKNADYSKSTKAATEAQLQRAMKDAQEAAEANDTDTHVKAGTYAVTTVKDAAGKDTQGVVLDVVNKTGTSVGKVTIMDVAKASDVGDVSQLSKEVQNAGGFTTVVDAINNVNTKVNTVDNKVGDLNYSSTNYVKSGDNVTTSISNLDKAIHDATTEVGKHSTVSAGNNIKVTPDTTDGKTDYKVSLSDDINVNSVTAKTVTTDNLTVNKSATIGKVTINADDKGTIGGLTNKTWDAKKITSGQAATEDQLQAATKNAVNYDGDSSKTITLRENTTIKNVANTSIEQGSKNAVNAGTIYNETRVKQDGKYVKVSNTAGENLSALDNQVASNSSNITNLNGRVNNLNSKVNKVGAGAAALAALHPLDFDPEDKWDFAVGYGNYRDANSVAVGAFYRPDDDTMFSVGTNFGNGENMINAGVSFKFGPKGKSQVRPGSTQEITELRATVARQDDQLKKQDNEIKELKAMVQQLMAKQDKQAATK